MIDTILADATRVVAVVEAVLPDLVVQAEDIARARAAVSAARHNPGGPLDIRQRVVESVFVDSAMAAVQLLRSALDGCESRNRTLGEFDRAAIESCRSGIHPPRWTGTTWVCCGCGAELDVRKRSI
jgi:hypothetical protein